MKRSIVLLAAAGLAALALVPGPTSAAAPPASPERVFPGREWERRTPESLNVDPATLDQIAEMLSSSGWIVKDGYVIKSWGNPEQIRDWFSSSKPIFSTLLFFAVLEGKVSSVDDKIGAWGWPLEGKDRAITFRHLANMTSGYMQPEEPGEAYAHNDFALALFIRTLERVFAQPITEAAAQRIYRPLGMQDDPHHQAVSRPGTPQGRARISVRDWARLAWFWMNKGRWDERQLLPASFFDRYMRPQVPADLPYSNGPNIDWDRPPEDYLGVRSFGGGSNHYNYGAGIYGFHWYFNCPGVVGTMKLKDVDLHLGRPFDRTWPDVPDDAIMTLGYGGNNTMMIPSLGVLLVSGGGAWKRPYMDPDNPDYFNNRVLRLLVDSVQSSKSR